jgi:oligopeptide/dipeptide ABC transporter ATP-binding protein
MSGPLLRVENLCVHFPVRRGWLGRQVGTIRAVEQLALSIERGRTLGLVGESGCGKSTAARAILRLIPSERGCIELDGQDLCALRGKRLRAARRHVQMIFQDPYASLDPRMTVFDIVAEPLRVHGLGRSRPELRARVAQLCERVGLDPTHRRRYPHELSGGQRQRVGIARALALGPKLVVADEPVSALDVSIRAQIVNLLGQLQAELGLGYLFIAHDLGVVRHVSHEVAVMVLGRIVERAPTERLFERPAHPYTQALLAAIAVADPDIERRRPWAVLAGEPPDPSRPPSGCAFHPRCPHAFERCRSERPELVERGAGHVAACHLAEPPAFELAPERCP